MRVYPVFCLAALVGLSWGCKSAESDSQSAKEPAAAPEPAAKPPVLKSGSLVVALGGKSALVPGVKHFMGAHTTSLSRVKDRKTGEWKDTVGQARLDTVAFAADGVGTLEAHLQLGDPQGSSLVIDGTDCPIARLHYGSGGVEAGDFNGFLGECRWKDQDVDFVVGVAAPATRGDSDSSDKK